MEKNYHENMPEKAEAVLEAVISLCDEGADITALKVADIAKKAGIGKGTVYEYFKTKEEIISRALLYSVEKEMTAIKKKVTLEQSFHGKINAVCMWVEENAKKRFWAIHLMNLDDIAGELGKKLKEKIEGKTDCGRYEDIIEEIINTGVKEGVIRPPRNLLEQDTAVNSMLLSLIWFFFKTKRYQDITAEEAKEYSLQILIKLLND